MPQPKKRSKKPRRTYYDPGARPKPRRVEPTANLGPTGNSRQQRRQRARMTFRDQLALAASVGFPTPLADAVAGTDMEAEWVAAWEKAYRVQR